VKLLDRLDIAPGWKGATAGLVAALIPFVVDLIDYLGLPPLPDDLVRSGQALLVALIVGAMALKARRAEG